MLIRPVLVGDDAELAELARVHRDARAAAVAAGHMPPSVHADEELAPFLAGRLAHDEVWVAEVDGRVVAYARLTPTWLDDLYVHPDHAGRGIGSALLDLVKTLRPGGFGLWVFEVNAPARAFYARHGLVETWRSDGSDNEEQAPDIRVEWRP